MRLALALLLPTSAGCVAADDELVEVLHARLGQPKLDLLLVIKSSACGRDDQNDIREHLHRLTESFATYEGGAPDLHIGVTTADLGVDGNFGVMSCDLLGDDGALVVPALQELENCGLQGEANFLAADLSDPSEEPGAQNFAGTLDESLACMIMVGDRGCGFRRPLSAMRRALAPSQPSNGGFLRDDADLAVMIVSDADDCSAADAGLYDPAVASLGPLSSFRCFAHGVECDQVDLNEPGVKTNCRASNTSPYFDDIDVFAEFLKDLKGPAQRVSIAVMAGTYGGSADTVEVVGDVGDPDVNGSCRREDGYGYSLPGIRLNSFVGAMGQAGRFFSLCADIGETLTRVGEFFRQRSSERCIRSPLADTDTDTVGLQPRCEVRLLGLDREPALVPSCDATSGDERCWSVEAAPAECGQITAAGLKLMLHGSDSAEDSLVLVARCKIDTERPASLVRAPEPQAGQTVSEPYMCPVEEF